MTIAQRAKKLRSVVVDQPLHWMEGRRRVCGTVTGKSSSMLILSIHGRRTKVAVPFNHFGASFVRFPYED